MLVHTASHLNPFPPLCLVWILPVFDRFSSRLHSASVVSSSWLRSISSSLFRQPSPSSPIPVSVRHRSVRSRLCLVSVRSDYRLFLVSVHSDPVYVSSPSGPIIVSVSSPPTPIPSLSRLRLVRSRLCLVSVHSDPVSVSSLSTPIPSLCPVSVHSDPVSVSSPSSLPPLWTAAPPTGQRTNRLGVDAARSTGPFTARELHRCPPRPPPRPCPLPPAARAAHLGDFSRAGPVQFGESPLRPVQRPRGPRRVSRRLVLQLGIS